MLCRKFELILESYMHLKNTNKSITHEELIFSLSHRSDLVETSGATSGLHLISSVFFGTGDLVFMEEFSYFIAINILRDGLRHNCQPG